MLMTTQSTDVAEKCFLQILDTLEELSAAGAAMEHDEDAGDEEREIFDRVIEEAVERGLDEETAERVFRAVLAFWRKSRQEDM